MAMNEHVRINEVGGSHGRDLVAAKRFNTGEVVYTMSGELVGEPTRTSIQVGEGQHIEDEYGQFINHSFNPTTSVSGRNLVALRDIEIGESITFDYTQNESRIASPFICRKTGKRVE